MVALVTYAVKLHLEMIVRLLYNSSGTELKSMTVFVII